VIEQQFRPPPPAHFKKHAVAGAAAEAPQPAFHSTFKNQTIQQLLAALYEMKLGHKTVCRRALYKHEGTCVSHHVSSCTFDLPLPPAKAKGRDLKRRAVMLFNHIMPVGHPGRPTSVPANAAPDYADSALQGLRALNELSETQNRRPCKRSRRVQAIPEINEDQSDDGESGTS